MKKRILTIGGTVALALLLAGAAFVCGRLLNGQALPEPTITSTQTTISSTTEEAEVRDLVEEFGKRLGAVSLLAADAAQQIQQQYSEFVSSTLLERWMNDVSDAPGRLISSPWPGRIEIATLSKQDSDRYEVTGFVIEVTSVEMVNGGAVDKIPVRVVVQREQDHWLITEYAEER
jgi:hypothetical protein